MTPPRKAKGDRGERDAVAWFARTFPTWDVRRRLQQGWHHDEGDLQGVPFTCVQVANVDDLLDAIGHKLPDVARQTARSGAHFGVLMIRRRGGRFIAVLDEENFARMLGGAVKHRQGYRLVGGEDG